MTDPQPQFLEVGQGEARRRIFYRTQEGDPAKGPGIVWLGGLKSEMTATKASALADWAHGSKRSFSRFDYSGHGVSDRAFQDCTIGDWLEDSLAILLHVCSGPQILVGSSMGGWLTLLAMRQLMSEKPDLPYSVSGAVLIAPAWDMTQTLIWERIGEAPRRALEEQGFYNWPSDYDDDPYIISARLIEEGRDHLFEDKPFDPGAPVRIIQGMQDPDVPHTHAIKLVDLIARDDVTLTLVKDGEHRMSRPQDLELLFREISVLSDAVGTGQN